MDSTISRNRFDVLADEYLKNLGDLGKLALGYLRILYPKSYLGSQELMFQSNLSYVVATGAFQSSPKLGKPSNLKSKEELIEIAKKVEFGVVAPSSLKGEDNRDYVIVIDSEYLMQLDFALRNCLPFHPIQPEKKGADEERHPIDVSPTSVSNDRNYRAKFHYSLGLYKGGGNGLGYRITINVVLPEKSLVARVSYEQWENLFNGIPMLPDWTAEDFNLARNFVVYDTTEDVAAKIPLGVIPLCMLKSTGDNLLARINRGNGSSVYSNLF
ncbi:hypothetical protein J4216_03915 [Candidatus Woesearchaeota archaeon]|nr:hypothetical protein [Candidatus Woesearchaeota archaeon]